MSEEARKRRAEEWKRFAERDGGLYEMLDEYRDAVIRMMETEVLDDSQHRAMIAELHAVRALRLKVQNIINASAVDQARIAEKAAIAAGEKKAFH